MSNFILIFICLIAGAAFSWFRKLPDSTPHILNTLVIYLALPALVFEQTPALIETTVLNLELLIPISMAWLVFLFAVIIFIPLGRLFRWSRATVGALLLTAGLGNTSFVGFPLLEALYGVSSLKTGVLIDQAGSFIVVSTLGLVAASVFSGTSVTIKSIAKRIFLFPPFIALVIAGVFYVFDVTLQDYLGSSLSKMSAMLVPLALISVGYQLRLRVEDLHRSRRPLFFGLLYKLIAAPALLTILYVWWLGSSSLSTEITLIESAMAPMITGAIIASEFELDSVLANLMVGVGVPVSLITVPIWYWILS